MQRLHENYRVVIHIKNHNLSISIIIILAFLLGINISHIYNEELLKTNVYYKNCGYPESCISGGRRLPPPPPHNRGAHGLPLPRDGGQSIMFDN